jgi:hypothetical protein
MSRYFAFRGRTVIFNARQASGISWDIHATYGWGESTEIYARGIALDMDLAISKWHHRHYIEDISRCSGDMVL